MGHVLEELRRRISAAESFQELWEKVGASRFGAAASLLTGRASSNPPLEDSAEVMQRARAVDLEMMD